MARLCAAARSERAARRSARAISCRRRRSGFLGWRSPARSTALTQLARRRGRRSRAMDRRRPASSRKASTTSWRAAGERAGPLVRAALSAQAARDRGLALFWSRPASSRLGQAATRRWRHLAAADFPPALAVPTLIAGALFDIVLGLLLLVRRFARAVLMRCWRLGFYLLVGSAWRRSSGLDPLGPLMKIVPVSGRDCCSLWRSWTSDERSLSRAQAGPHSRRHGAVRHRARHRLLHVHGAPHRRPGHDRAHRAHRGDRGRAVHRERRGACSR